MDDHITPPRAGVAPAAKRGRPPREDLRAQLARLEAETARVRVAVREAEQRKFMIVGEAIAAEMNDNPELRKTVWAILARRVTSAQARADIAPLLMAASGQSLSGTSPPVPGNALPGNGAGQEKSTP